MKTLCRAPLFEVLQCFGLFAQHTIESTQCPNYQLTSKHSKRPKMIRHEALKPYAFQVFARKRTKSSLSKRARQCDSFLRAQKTPPRPTHQAAYPNGTQLHSKRVAGWCPVEHAFYRFTAHFVASTVDFGSMLVTACRVSGMRLTRSLEP